MYKYCMGVSLASQINLVYVDTGHLLSVHLVGSVCAEQYWNGNMERYIHKDLMIPL